MPRFSNNLEKAESETAFFIYISKKGKILATRIGIFAFHAHIALWIERCFFDAYIAQLKKPFLHSKYFREFTEEFLVGRFKPATTSLFPHSIPHFGRNDALTSHHPCILSLGILPGLNILLNPPRHDGIYTDNYFFRQKKSTLQNCLQFE